MQMGSQYSSIFLKFFLRPKSAKLSKHTHTHTEVMKKVMLPRCYVSILKDRNNLKTFETQFKKGWNPLPLR